MTTLAIDRSTDVLSAAVVRDGETLAAREFPSSNARSADWLAAVSAFLREALSVPGGGPAAPFAAVDAFLAGTGPGSFAGVRAALAALRGLALPGGKPVAGLPSPFAYTAEGRRTAVVGDARRGRLWSILFDGSDVARGFALAAPEETFAGIPPGCTVCTPDAARIGDALRGAFGPAFAGGGAPSAARLAEVAAIRPQAVSPNPLPVYLTPAVRPPEKPAQQKGEDKCR